MDYNRDETSYFTFIEAIYIYTSSFAHDRVHVSEFAAGNKGASLSKMSSRIGYKLFFSHLWGQQR